MPVLSSLWCSALSCLLLDAIPVLREGYDACPTELAPIWLFFLDPTRELSILEASIPKPNSAQTQTELSSNPLAMCNRSRYSSMRGIYTDYSLPTKRLVAGIIRPSGGRVTWSRLEFRSTSLTAQADDCAVCLPLPVFCCP